VRANRRPVNQAAHLAKSGVRVVLIEPDLAGKAALGPDLLAPGRTERAFAAGLRAGARQAAEALAAWSGEPLSATHPSTHKL
jgi:hypothetical protein